VVVSDRVRRLVTPLVDQIVYASTAYTELKSALNDQSRVLVDLSRPSGGPADERLRVAVDMLRPFDLVGRELIRVGGEHDGGYLMAPELSGVSGAISLGVGPDVSWDADLGRRGIRVAMFDPNVRRLPGRVANGSFHRIGVSGTDDSTARFRPLPELVAIAGLSEEHDLLLKMDVEGAEWSVLATLPDRGLSDYQQVVAELHHLGQLADRVNGERMLTGLRALTRTHVPVHVHANNYSRLWRFDDHWFPDAVEVSFVRRDMVGEIHTATRVRSALDVPSDRRVADIDLEGLLALPSDNATTNR
jgi:hypothetical protein